MNVTIDKFLLAGDKFMSKMHFRQLRFTYSACRLFTKANKKRNSKDIYNIYIYVYIYISLEACF